MSFFLLPYTRIEGQANKNITAEFFIFRRLQMYLMEQRWNKKKVENEKKKSARIKLHGMEVESQI